MKFLTPNLKESSNKKFINFHDDTNVKYQRKLSPIEEIDEENFTSTKKRTAHDDFAIT